MELSELKNKIVEVWQSACSISAKHGHTYKKGRKFAKHIVALSIQKINHLTDRELADFLYGNEIGKIIGYRSRINYSIFSKVRKVSTEILKQLYDTIIHDKFKGRQLKLMAQDSTHVHAHSQKDKDASFGHRTPSKMEQIANKEIQKSFVFGYKVHMICDTETEMPLSIVIRPANTNDKKLFKELFHKVKYNFYFGSVVKFLADAAYDSTDIYKELRRRNVIPLIAINGRGHYKSRKPKDPDYGKRWAIERIFSRLKGVCSLGMNRYMGMPMVTVHVYSCLLAYVLKYLQW
jgi:hypothetical protein